jgi:lactate dehydrogenase-like 2-hydroxyacid dehydrogenase
MSIGQWQGKTTLGHDPQGKVLGILGMGGIGRVSPVRSSHRIRQLISL